MSKYTHIIEGIKKLGKSKYWIAKNCNVSWQTVHMWSKGVFSPSRENEMKLDLAFRVAKENNLTVDNVNVE